MDAAAFGGQVACEEAWAARTLGPQMPGAMRDASRLSSCPLINEEGRPYSETTTSDLDDAGSSSAFAAGSGSGALGSSTLAAMGPGVSSYLGAPNAPPRFHRVQGVRSGKFVFKGSEEVMSIVNVQLVG